MSPPTQFPSDTHDNTFTFLFTDIEGSTRLWRQFPGEMRAALEAHDALLKETISRHGGHVFKTFGDAVCAAFTNAPAAVRAACDAQLSLQKTFDADALPLRVRMALHTGHAQKRDDDYFGLSLSQVARLLSVLHGGQIALSQVTASLVTGHLDAPLSLHALGEHRLPDFDQATAIFALYHPDLPRDFPPLRTHTATPNNLPRQRTSFIGREREIADVKILLANEALVTLSGAGGCGKTRLSLALAQALLADFDTGGVWFVDLAPLTDGSFIGRTVAQTLRISAEADHLPEESLAAFLAGKETLLILDNCEHLIEDCARFADFLLQSNGAPGLRILATSREALGVQGETIWPVPTLSLPAANAMPSVRKLAQYEAIRLFVERATASTPAFRLTEADAPHVAAICRRLDGIPLAIELAAARVRALSVAQIDARLSDRFRLLGSSPVRTVPNRQQTLRAAIDWSYDLLTGEERVLLRRLSVFSGGWTLDAAEAICGSAPDEADCGDCIEGLFQLVRKSLVVFEERANRYRLLETVREFARELLASSGETTAISTRHQRFFTDLGKEAEPHLRGREQKAWFERLETDHDNIRAALAFDSGTDAPLVLGASITWFWSFCGHNATGRMILTRLLEQYKDKDKESYARATNAAALLALAEGDLAVSKTFFLRSLAFFQQFGYDSDKASALANLGIIAGKSENFDEARHYLSESLSIQQRRGDETRIARILDTMGGIEILAGDYAKAIHCFERGLATHQRLGDLFSAANDLHNLGVTAEKTGQLPNAMRYYAQSLCLRDQIGADAALLQTILSLAHIAHQAEYSETAAHLLGKANFFVNNKEAVWLEKKYELDHAKLLEEIGARFSEDYLRELLQQGQALTLLDIVEPLKRKENPS